MQKCFSSCFNPSVICWLFYCFICSISSQEKQISKAKILDGSWDGESTRQGTTFTFCHTITIYSSIDNGVLNCHSFLLNIYWPNLDKGFQLFLRNARPRCDNIAFLGGKIALGPCHPRTSLSCQGFWMLLIATHVLSVLLVSWPIKENH
jgi:hypothetical protein